MLRWSVYGVLHPAFTNARAEGAHVRISFSQDVDVPVGMADCASIEGVAAADDQIKLSVRSRSRRSCAARMLRMLR